MSQNKPKISVCIITKNEEENIKKCLTCLKPYPFELIVVDTGSTDGTREVAEELADRVYDFTWINDFSAARNFAASKARNEWILVIDSDEFLETVDLDELYVTTESYPSSIGNIILKNQLCPDDATQFYRSRLDRLYNKYYYKFKGTIHEQLTPTGNHKHSFFYTSLTVYHTGYALTEEENRNKATRNLNLLLSDLEQNGATAYTCFQIGQSYKALKDYTNALEYYDMGLSFDIDTNLGYVQTMVESYGYCLLELKQIEQALLLQNIYDEFNKRADFVFLMGHIYMNAGMFQAAIDEFKKATTMENYATMGTNSYLAWYNAGVIYEVLGNTCEALKCYKECGTYEKAQERLRLLSQPE